MRGKYLSVVVAIIAIKNLGAQLLLFTVFVSAVVPVLVVADPSSSNVLLVLALVFCWSTVKYSAKFTTIILVKLEIEPVMHK